MALNCQAINVIAQKLHLINDASPPRLCDISWNLQQIVSRSLKPLPKVYLDLRRTIFDSCSTRLDLIKKVFILHGEIHGDAIISIDIRIKDYYFTLRDGSRGLTPFILDRHEELLLLIQMPVNEGEEGKAPIPLTELVAITHFYFINLKVQDYHLFQAQVHPMMTLIFPTIFSSLNNYWLLNQFCHSNHSK